MQSPWVRNLLISLGAVWLTVQLVVPASLLFGKIGTGITYGNSFLAAIAMGVMFSLGRAFCACLAAIIVMKVTTDSKPIFWSGLVALLYAITAQPRVHWNRTPTTWDKISHGADILFPAIACLGVAFAIWRFGRKSDRPAFN